MRLEKNNDKSKYVRLDRLAVEHIVTAQPNPTLGWCNSVVGIKMSTPTRGNFSPTSRQPRKMKLGIQAQLNLLIKVGQEKRRVNLE